MVQDLHPHGISCERVAIDQLLNPIDEDAIIEPVTVENPGLFVSGLESLSVDMLDSEEDNDSHTTEEELKGLAVAASTLERRGWMD